MSCSLGGAEFGVLGSAGAGAGGPSPLAGGSTIVTDLIERGASGSAVDLFARQHDLRPPNVADEPAQARYYRDLIPLTAPRPGEQYAFHVDLDACSGCKACVVACHNLNGLEDDETWRSVGLLHGGTSAEPLLQHVTTACHHCVEPACLEGCPVLAYEKDPTTGIVRHLDDQCIGCQYCILKCPYDVPQYSRSKGIVRKCDMCQDRLAVGEAPACVQSCPNQAIRVTLVNRQQVIDESELHPSLPGAPDPSYTLPTTIYHTRRVLPRNTLPADYFAVQPAHQHRSLVWMLVLTQLAVGGLAVDQGLMAWFAELQSPEWTPPRLAQIVAALVVALVGSLAALFHLGRPLYAYRAVIGLRTSWLSREIVAFGLFAASGVAYAGVSAWNLLAQQPPTTGELTLGWLAAGSGLAGVACSVMIYVDTRRPLWATPATGAKFFLTALLLGCQTAQVALVAGAIHSDNATAPTGMSSVLQALCTVTIAAAVVKLAVELSLLRHLLQRATTPLKRSAMLLTGALRQTWTQRLAAGVLGGVLLPLGLYFNVAGEIVRGELASLMLLATVGWGASLCGEWLERSLFFSSSVAPKMPGTLTP